MAFTITCRTCGMIQELPEERDVAPCLACGTINSRPRADEDGCEILARATKQRLRCDFVHAENSYQYVLRENPEEHEALWGLVQCRYAVEYVKDPRTGKPMPIVHGVKKRPMLTDPDFREACDLAPEDVRKEYRQEAEYIDGAMARIRDLAVKGEPYEIFLCHKTSRTDGVEGYTEDFKRATDLYILLMQMGYKVFFAPFAGLIPGENYEAGIYHALTTAKVMLVVCSNQDYINSPWVRTEWQRFLEMSYEDGADKHLIPLLYDGFPPRRLPDDFRQLQAITMGELNAKDNLVAAVKGYVGEKVTAPQAVEPKPVEPSKPIYAPESDFETEAVDGGVAITGYTGSGGEVLIPPLIGGERVTSIGDEAFEECSDLMSVSIPESVTSIGESAFDGCSSLTSVSIPESVTSIGKYVFYGCGSLTSVSIPESVTSIGESAFSCCSSLTSINIPDSVTSIGERAFWDCSSLTSVSIPESVTSIGGSAFYCCSSLTSVSIPESVTNIGERAFRGCSSLTSVCIPGSVTNLGSNPFANCKVLTSITVAAGNKKYYVRDGVLMSRDNSLVCYPAGLTAKNYTIPASVTSIEGSAFCGCSSLTSVSVPESVTSIGKDAFQFCRNLTLRVHPNTPAHTYAQQNNLRFELIPSAPAPERQQAVGELVRMLDELPSATASQSAAQPVATKPEPPQPKLVQPRPQEKRTTPAPDFRVTPTTGGVAVIGYTGNAAKVAIPREIGGERVVAIDREAFRGNMMLEEVVLPEGVRRIGYGAFRECTNLRSVTLPKSLTTLQENAFQSCRKLQRITLPKELVKIPQYAFNACTSLKEIVIPEKVTSIGESAFDYCTSLTSVTLPAGLRQIGNMAFYRCAALNRINLPDSVQLGKDVFGQCGKLPASITRRSATSFAGFLDKIFKS